MKCPYCGNEARWCDNAEVYGKRFGRSYMCYWCKPCKAYVGCHNNSRTPLGTMANKELREWRQKAHAVVDPLWKSRDYKRRTVYLRLSEAFGKQVHIAESDIQQCKEIIESVPLLFNLNKKRFRLISERP